MQINLFPALAWGVRIGLGVCLASTLRRLAFHNLSWTGGEGHSISSPASALLELELMLQAVDGKDSTVTFDKFPYYLAKQTRRLLSNAAFMHLNPKQLQLSKYTKSLLPASRTVLLTGPSGTETYHETLAKALAHSFGAKLLLLDMADLSLKMQSNCGGNLKKESLFLHLAHGLVQRCFRLLRLSKIATSGAARNGSRLSWAFEDKMLVAALHRVLQKLSQEKPTILYLRDVENLIFSSPETCSLFQRMINKLTGTVFIIGSRILKSSGAAATRHEKLAALFPYNIDIKPPQGNANLVKWRSQLEEDRKARQTRDNRIHISEILAANDVECDDLDMVSFPDKLLSSNLLEEIVVSTISHHLMNVDSPQYRNGRLILASTSLTDGLSLIRAGLLERKDAKLRHERESNPRESNSEITKARVRFVREAIQVVADAAVEMVKRAGKGDSTAVVVKKGKKKVNEHVADVATPAPIKEHKKGDEAKHVPADAATPITPTKEVPLDKKFERQIRLELIPAEEIGVSFQDVGALDNVKEALQELVMLPLQRPNLFNKGGLIKPCKGILLFGPPGTGKTMLAKAVAAEAGASFINVSMSTITSKWFGDGEKCMRALFTLAAKVAPTIIFIDEVDSMLGQRSKNGEHEETRKMKNEFMAHWDGLLSKEGERVLVLAATNRPFDLDDAIVRRFERRIMVDLPEKDNRERILKTILDKESISHDIDFSELANMTQCFSGSDLKNLCTAAAYRPIRELMKMEQQKQRADKREDLATTSSSHGGTREIPLRPLNMEDLKQAKTQVSCSFAADGAAMAQLKEWNELYGEGGSRKKKRQLTYFL